MGAIQESEGPYRGNPRELSESAKRLAAASAAMPFSGISMAAAAERARNLMKQTPTSQRHVSEYPLHTVIPNPPLKIIIPQPKSNR